MDRVAWTVGSGLATRGHDVRVVTTGHPSGVVEDQSRSGMRVHYVPGTTWRRYQRRWWTASHELLRREHAVTPFDVILSQSAGGLGYLGAARMQLGIPCAVLLYGSARSAWRTTWRAARHPRGAYRLVRMAWRLLGQRSVWRSAVPAVDEWLAVSAEVAAANEGELGLPAGSTTVVPTGVDTEHFRPDPDAGAAMRARLGIAPVAPVLVLAARLEREKGVDVALDAARLVLADHPDLRVLVAGAGHDESRLRRCTAERGLERVCTFLGLLDHDRLASVLAAGDLFLLPTLCEEARPASAVEASAAGLPIVASRCDGIAGVVADGSTGLLMPRGDPGALASAILRLLADDDTRRSMGERAREEALHHWSVAAMVDPIERVLVDLVARRDARPREA